MNTINFAFELWQKVLIKEIQRPGRITGILQDFLGIQYRVQYWNNGDLKMEWLPEDELELR